MTAKVSFIRNRSSPRAPPPTFLFLYIQLSKNRRTHRPSNRFHKAQNSRPEPLNQHQANQETLERRSSSPAAPPPSSVIGLIDPHPHRRQQGFSWARHKSHNQLKLNGISIHRKQQPLSARLNGRKSIVPGGSASGGDYSATGPTPPASSSAQIRGTDPGDEPPPICLPLQQAADVDVADSMGLEHL